MLDKNDLKLAENLDLVAGIYFSMTDFNKAESYIKRSIKIYEKINKNDGVISAKNAINIISNIKNDKFNNQKLNNIKLKHIYENISTDHPAAVFQFKENAFIDFINGSYEEAIFNLNKAKDLILRQWVMIIFK